MLEYTGVQAVSVARGCIGNPWVFRQARQLMDSASPSLPSVNEQREVLLEHYRLCAALNGERVAGRMMRKFGVRFSEHHPRADDVRCAFIAVETREDWIGVLESFYERSQVANTCMAGSTSSSPG